MTGRHQQLHDKRDVSVVYETDYSYVTTQLPNVVVYVDENGTPYSTATEGQTPATSAVASVVASSVAQPASSAAASSSVVVASSPTTFASVYKASSAQGSTTQVAASSTKATSSKVASSSAAASSSSSSSGGPSGYGIVYSPYTSSGGCKSQDQVNSDFATINSFAQSNGDTWSFVRTYGTDCNQVSTVLSAAKDYNLKIFAGIYNIWDDSAFQKEIQILIAAANGDWSRFDTIAVGNEVVNNGQVAASAVAGKVATVKSALSAAGYTGKYVAVDTLVAMIANPELCSASDYVAVNSHPFFDGGVAAADSGPWLLQQMERVSDACGGKDVWITETGWPTQGDTNGVAIPSTENQKAAISSMKKSVSSNIIWFTAFNDMWKSDSSSTFNAEKYWGICN